MRLILSRLAYIITVIGPRSMYVIFQWFVITYYLIIPLNLHLFFFVAFSLMLANKQSKKIGDQCCCPSYMLVVAGPWIFGFAFSEVSISTK